MGTLPKPLIVTVPECRSLCKKYGWDFSWRKTYGGDKLYTYEVYASKVYKGMKMETVRISWRTRLGAIQAAYAAILKLEGKS